MHANATRSDSIPAAPSISTVLEALQDAYGAQQPPRSVAPIDELIATILSQNTSDVNTERAYASLRLKYRTWDDVLLASDADIADSIRSGGLADRKAPRIRQVLEEVRSRTGGFDLTFLCNMPIDDAKLWLQSLPGVGPKTAACVLLFSLHVPAMPVDTHVHRVALRLGWIAPATSAERAHELLQRQIDPACVLDAHLLLIKHGRATCHARRPDCRRCVVADRCPSVHEFLKANWSTV